MAVDKLVDSTQLDADLTSVANAIRAKSGGNNQLAFPSGFVSEIGNIPSGGTLVTKTITENGTYDAEDDNADGYSSVTVNVAGGMELLASGTYTLASDPASTITIPVSYSGTPHFAVIILNTEITGVGHAVAAARYFMNPVSDMDSVFPYNVFTTRVKTASNSYGYSSNADNYSLRIGADSLYIAKPGNSYPWKAGTYSWYIYGEASA